MRFPEYADGACLGLLAELPAPTPILAALQRVQAHFGYVPDPAIELVAKAANASRADVYGVLTFYSDLRRTPPHSVEVHICMGEACQAVGARELLRKAEELVGPDLDVSRVYCLGNCALGPTAVVNQALIGRATKARIVEGHR